ncbi:MAG: hypothetical protein ACLVGL_03330 [Waltera sp.]
MSANTKIVVLRRKELLYTGIFAALGVLFVILLLMLLLPGKAADTSGAPDSPDSTAETVMPDNVADLGRIPQSAQTEDVSTGAVADTDAVLDNASGPVGTDNTYIPGIYTTELILGSETVNVEVIVNDHAITSLCLADPDETLTTMYPLLEPTMDSLSEQICETQDLSQVTRILRRPDILPWCCWRLLRLHWKKQSPVPHRKRRMRRMQRMHRQPLRMYRKRISILRHKGLMCRA